MQLMPDGNVYDEDDNDDDDDDDDYEDRSDPRIDFFPIRHPSETISFERPQQGRAHETFYANKLSDCAI
ncbi:hypothetical protein PoB_002015100 [Plakobranchus ocellatus]|uniref:Uncharacterized protein n=1 Tax=Plakobranchus ocellatus TaxID=259542 RepID=A0AAV3ZCK2_9GAST|nr:hypothetical protein PoB_002015100 [Plakobranchus ocellatus]